jgi:diketogulonate reductase-like aldo/keto reductase
MREATQLNQAPKVRTTLLPSGRPMPVLGQGTWRMGEDRARRKAEVAALRLGLDLGMNHIDTAEMYAEGGAEEVVAEAIADGRADVFVVTKVYPQNATRRGAIDACERSLRRLKTDYIDLYLLHWRGDIPLSQAFEAFQSLKESGKIRDYGVSNFDVADMEESFGETGGDEIANEQVLYNLGHRGIEWDLIRWCRARRIPITAYSPIGHNADEQKQILGNRAVKAVALRHGVTPVQVVLAWLMRQPDIVVIPKAVRPEHIRENRAAHDLKLTERDFKELDQAFPPPTRKISLETS